MDEHQRANKQTTGKACRAYLSKEVRDTPARNTPSKSVLVGTGRCVKHVKVVSVRNTSGSDQNVLDDRVDRHHVGNGVFAARHYLKETEAYHHENCPSSTHGVHPPRHWLLPGCTNDAGPHNGKRLVATVPVGWGNMQTTNQDRSSSDNPTQQQPRDLLERADLSRTRTASTRTPRRTART